jgi:hypothetical protein
MVIEEQVRYGERRWGMGTGDRGGLRVSFCLPHRPGDHEGMLLRAIDLEFGRQDVVLDDLDVVLALDLASGDGRAELEEPFVSVDVVAYVSVWWVALCEDAHSGVFITLLVWGGYWE